MSFELLRPFINQCMCLIQVDSLCVAVFNQFEVEKTVPSLTETIEGYKDMVTCAELIDRILSLQQVGLTSQGF